MKRREFLGTLGAVAALPLFSTSGRPRNGPISWPLSKRAWTKPATSRC